MSEAVDLGRAYRGARERVTSLVRPLGADQLATSVPACPGWTVHDVVSHLAGVATDVVNGHIRSIATPEQTAAQVQARAETPTNVVLREWERASSQLEVLLSKGGTSNAPTVLDVNIHEQDIRGALSLPGNRTGDHIEFGVERTVGLWLNKIESAGLRPVRIGPSEHETFAGDPDAAVWLRASPFEFLRATYGRRSRPQIVARLSGADRPEDYAALLCLFGPAEQDIIE